MAGFATDYLGEMSGLVICLIRQHFPVRYLAVEGWRQPGPIRPHLGQRMLDVLEMFRRPQKC